MLLTTDNLTPLWRWCLLSIAIITIGSAYRWFQHNRLMKRVRGFKNVKIIKAALQKLFLGLLPSGVSEFSKDLTFSLEELNSEGDKTIWVQKVARRIADHFGIITSTVVVTFRSDLQAPGCVELSPSSEFFVDLRSDLRDFSHEMIATLAHEVAHIFLFRKGIKMESVFENEVLTDTAAVFLGCGAFILNGSSFTINRSGDTETSSLRKLGYLSVDEFGYVLAKRENYFKTRTQQKLNRGLPRKGYSAGRLRVRIEKILSRTLAMKKLFPIMSLFNKKRCGADVDSKILFPCGFCGQQLRVPSLGKRLEATCPVCRVKHICYS